MSNFSGEEREALAQFAADFFSEAVDSMEKELGRNLTIEELHNLRDDVLKKFFGREEE